MRLPLWLGVLAGVVLPAALMTAGCLDSDPTAPAGSTITVSADPQTVATGGSSTITATVRSSNGVRLPDQEVIFSTSQGTLKPPAQTSLITDKNGQATSILTSASNATVTAQSGSISSTTSVNVVNCSLSTITLTLPSPGQNPLTNCSNSVDLLAMAIDTSGGGCPGVAIDFSAFPFDPNTDLSGNFSPATAITDASGQATSTFSPDSTCSTRCTGNGGAVTCETEVFADDQTGNFGSSGLRIFENIP